MIRARGYPGQMADGGVGLVVTDLDGTLSDADERVHPASARAVPIRGYTW